MSLFHHWLWRDCLRLKYADESWLICSLPGGWATQLTLCVFLFIWFTVFGVGFGMWAAILNLVQNVNTYSAFAE